MKVIKTYPTNEDGHVIETGRATWNLEETSVRNRYRTSNGGFSPRSSSEVPIADLRRIIEAVSAEDLLGISDIAAIISALAASLSRKLKL